MARREGCRADDPRPAGHFRSSDEATVHLLLQLFAFVMFSFACYQSLLFRDARRATPAWLTTPATAPNTSTPGGTLPHDADRTGRWPAILRIALFLAIGIVCATASLTLPARSGR